MAFDPEFLELMPDTITYRPKTTMDSYGRETYGDPVVIRCRIVGKPRLIRNVEGDQVAVSTTIYTGGAFGIEADGEITMPDGSKPPIQAVYTYPDEEGPHHQEVVM
jgi:hypothetical protein